MTALWVLLLAQGHHGKIEWVSDPAAGLARARAENRPVMLYFTADW
jgi:thiol:disulfide interchange protein